MKMEVVHCLAALWPIIDDHSVPLFQVFSLCNMRNSPEQMPQDGLVLLRGMLQLGQATPGLWNHKNVRGRAGGDVSKGVALVILVYDLGRNLLT